eukprot:PhF_6_TR23245/c0_g1_i4/m.32605
MKLMLALLFITLGTLMTTFAQCPANPVLPDDTSLPICAIGATNFDALQNEWTQRDCACRKGMVIPDQSGALNCLESSITKDCTTMICERRAWFAEIELYGPYASGCQDADTMLLPGLKQRYDNGYSTCVNKICSSVKTCAKADLDMACENSTVPYNYFLTNDIARVGYPLKLKQTFPNYSLKTLGDVKDVVSKILNVVASEIIILFANTTTDTVQIFVGEPVPMNYSNTWIEESDRELWTRMQSDRAVLDTIRAAPPAYCNEYIALGSNAQSWIDGPVTYPNSIPAACKAQIPDDQLALLSSCAQTACGCLNYNPVADSQCAIQYDTSLLLSSKQAAQCYANQFKCLNDTILPYMRGAQDCAATYNALDDPDRAYKACMRTHCVNEASRFFPQSTINDICLSVKQTVVDLPPTGQQVKIKPQPTTTPPPITMDPNIPIDTAAPTPAPPTTTAPPITPTPVTTTPGTPAPPTPGTPAPPTSGPSAPPTSGPSAPPLPTPALPGTPSPTNSSVNPTVTPTNSNGTASSSPSSLPPSPSTSNRTNTTSNSTTNTTVSPSNSTGSNSTVNPYSNQTTNQSTTNASTAPKTNTPTPTNFNNTGGAAAGNSTMTGSEGGGNVGMIVGVVIGVIVVLAIGGYVVKFMRAARDVANFKDYAEMDSVPLNQAVVPSQPIPAPNPYGGTSAPNPYGGTSAPNPYGGTSAPNPYGG